MNEGKIAYVTYRMGTVGDISVINADGTGQVCITNSLDGWPSWSPDGSKITFTSNRDDNYEIYVMDADGSHQTRLTTNTAGDFDSSWSPDGKKIAFVSYRNGNGDIYIMNADGSGQTRLTSNTSGEFYPAWSPDGRKIAFVSYTLGYSEIYVMNADGSHQTRLTTTPNHQTSVYAEYDDWPQWSPDGSKITYTFFQNGNYEIYVMNATGTGKKRLTNNTAADLGSAWSPDGSKIVFYSNRDLFSEIYVMNKDGTGLTRLTSNLEWDGSPAWAPLLAVSGPDGGQNWKQGTPQTIRWSYTGNPGAMVKILLLRGVTVNRIINASTPIGLAGSGSYRWIVPYNQVVGTDYRIRISSTSIPAYVDTSNGNFTISAGIPITITVPNGGQNWTRGSVQTIRWSYTGNPGAMVKILLLRGVTVNRVINASTPIGSAGSGSYRWIVPYNQVIGTDYRIRISSTSKPAITDTSNANFTITGAPTMVTGPEWRSELEAEG